MQPDFGVLNLNSPTISPPESHSRPNQEIISTDPRLSSQPNEIFSFRGEPPSGLHIIQQQHQHHPPPQAFPMVPLAEEEQKASEEELDEDLEEVSFLLLKMVKSNLVFQLFFMFFFAHFLWDWDMRILLGLSWFNDAVNCFICAERLWKLKKRPFCCLMSKLQLKLFDDLILIVYKVVLWVYLQYPQFPMSFGLLLLLFQNLSQAFYMIYVKFYRKKPILSESIEFGFRFFVLLQGFMVSMNMTGVLHWLWKDVFWCFWVVFSILSGATLGFALIFLGKIYQKCFETVDNFELKGLFWLFGTTAGITINSAVTVTEICEFLDEKGRNMDDMFTSFVGISTYFGTMFLYCIFFRKDLIKFLEKIGSEEDEDSEPDQRFASNSTELKKVEVKKFKTEKNPSKYFFPSFLKKTSSTYFKAVNSSIMQTVSSTLRKPPRSSSKSNSFMMASKPRLNNSKDDKSPLSTISPTKNKDLNISDQGPCPKDRKGINFNISDPGQHGKNLTQNSHSPKFHSPVTTEDADKQLRRKNSNVSGENQDQSMNSCLICFENTPDSVFMDCGHGGMCYTCATDIFKKTGECYLCRKVIKQVLLLDLSRKEGHYYKVKASTRIVNANEDNNTSKGSEKT